MLSEPAPHPPHTAPLAEQCQGLLRSLAFIQNPLRGFQPGVYEGGISEHKSLFVKMHVLTEAEAISELLIKKVRHFRKSKLNQRIIEPVAREGLITTHDQQWRRQRKAVAPIFRPRHMQILGSVVDEAIQAFLDELRRSDIREINAKEAMSDLSFDILSKALLGDPKGAKGQALRQAADVAISTVGRLRIDDFLPMPDWYPRLMSPRSATAIRTLREGARQVLEEASTCTEEINLVHLLAQPHSEHDIPQLSLTEQIDNLIGFFIAGHESTAITLTWMLYLLAAYPEVQSRVRQEIFGQSLPDKISFKDLPQLPFTRAVLNETLRLYPSIPIIGREAVQDTSLNGTPIKAGDTIVVPIYVLHRSEKYWDNPHSFDPDRFLRNPELAKPGNRSFLPFGAGPRICIGASFAVLESMLLVANLLKKYQISLAQKTDIEPTISVSLRPSDDIFLQLNQL